MNVLKTCVYLNIIPLGSYDVLIVMDWLDAQHVVLECHNKTSICIDEELDQRMLKDIPRPISIREISTM